MSWFTRLRDRVTGSAKNAVVNVLKEEAANELVKILVKGSDGEAYEQEVSLLVKQRLGILNIDNASLKRSVSELKESLQVLSMEYETLKAENQQLKAMLANPVNFNPDQIKEAVKELQEKELEVF